MTLWLRRCLRCGGDLYETQDTEGNVWVACLQCGAVLTAQQEDDLRHGQARMVARVG